MVGLARPGNAVLQSVGDALGKRQRPAGPALQNDQGAGERPHPLQRGEGIGAAAGDVQLLLGADHEIAVRKDGLQMRRRFGAADEAEIAAGMAGDAPKHRPVIDVEDDLRAS